jgi:tetratricopeptide (TPR) repeat protein
LLAGAITAAYANAVTTGLTLDAGALVLGNPAVRALSVDNVRTILSSDYWYPMATNGLYRPVTTLTFLGNWSLLGNGERALGYHIVNVLLHFGCAASLYALLMRLGFAVIPARLATLLFAVHPVATEAVTNVAGRADLLATLFVVAGLWCNAHAHDLAGRRHGLWMVALAASATLAAFSKESGLVLVPLVLTWNLAFRPTAGRRRALWQPLAVFVPVLALMALARWWVRVHGYPPESSPIDNPILEVGFWSGRATALEVLWLQLATLAFPFELSADYSYAQIPVIGPPLAMAAVAWALIGAVALVAIGIGARLAWRRQRPLAFLLLFFLLALLPTANLLVVIGSIRADRFLYLPLAPFSAALVAVAWLGGAVGRRRAVLGFGIVALVLCTIRTVRRNRDWQDDLTLWQATVVTAPDSAKAHNGLGEQLAARGRPGDLEQAIAHGETAVAIRRDYVPALANLATYYVRRGDALAVQNGQDPRSRAAYLRAVALARRAAPLDRRAAARFRRAMRARGHAGPTIPDYGNQQLQRALLVARARLGRWRGVLAAARRLQRLDPWDGGTWIDTSVALVRLGRVEDAAVALHQARLLGGGDEVEARLVDVYRLMGDDADAVRTDASGRGALDAASPLVRRHRCRAATELAATYEDAALPEPAARLRTQARGDCGG